MLRRTHATGFACLSALVATGCVTGPDRVALTPSGRPEAFFPRASAADVNGKLAEQCLSHGDLIEHGAGDQLVCSMELPPASALLAQLLIGNAFSTLPVRKLRFTLISAGGGVRVQAYEWIETQTAFGQTKMQEINSNEEFNTIEQSLTEIGGEFPPGTIDAAAVSSLDQCNGKDGNDYRICYNAYVRGKNRAVAAHNPGPQEQPQTPGTAAIVREPVRVQSEQRSAPAASYSCTMDERVQARIAKLNGYTGGPRCD